MNIIGSSRAFAFLLSLSASVIASSCVTESEADSQPPEREVAEAAAAAVSPSAVPAPAGWRDLGGYNVSFTVGNGPPPATGWRTNICNTTHGYSTTYMPGMVASGTFVLFKLRHISLANFERYWSLTSGAPAVPSTTTVIDRMPIDITTSQTAAITRDDELVSGSVWVGGYRNCYQRTSASAPLTSSWNFNATPGSGTADPGDGRPYITELCGTRDFAFIEVFVP